MKGKTSKLKGLITGITPASIVRYYSGNLICRLYIVRICHLCGPLSENLGTLNWIEYVQGAFTLSERQREKFLLPLPFFSIAYWMF